MDPVAGHDELSERRGSWLVRCLQVLFLAIVLPQLDKPILSSFNERQNQTFDTAQHIFHDGWSAVFTPKTSFSLPGYEAKPFTVVRQEFPFHGVLGWPLAKLTGHEMAAVRLVSIVFALLSIHFLYLILRQWLSPGISVLGATIWTFSPLVLQLGQGPMPDILCTTGMLAAFWYAVKNRLLLSSGWFLFAVLAKVSAAVFGLPILVALLVVRNTGTFKGFLRVSLAWGALPLIGLVSWTALEFIDPNTPWTVAKIISQRGGAHLMLGARFYILILAGLIPYGAGILGVVGGLVCLNGKSTSGMARPVMWALLASNLLYFYLVFSRIPEPQYLLPSLAWLIVAAMFGINYLAGRIHTPVLRRTGIVVLAVVQLTTAVIFTCDLKADRLSNYSAVEQAAKLIPPGARVIVGYRFYGASPAVWLGHNVLAISFIETLKGQVPALQKLGFTYLVLLDVKSHSEGFWQQNMAKTMAGVFHMSRSQTPESDPLISDFTAPASPFRVYCDQRFNRVYTSDDVVVYALPSTTQTGQ